MQKGEIATPMKTCPAATISIKLSVRTFRHTADHGNASHYYHAISERSRVGLKVAHETN